MEKGAERAKNRAREIATLTTRLIELQEEQEPEDSERWGFNDGGDGNKFFKLQQSMLWVPTETNFSNDFSIYQTYNEKQQNLLKRCLTIFLTLDGAVIDSVATKMFLMAKTLSLKLPYIAQMYMESIHSQSYDLQLRAIVPDEKEREKLLKEADSEVWISRYTDYDRKHILYSNEDEIFMLAAQAALEGVGFIALFAIIFYFKKHPVLKDVKGITSSNTLIARDESTHRDYAVYRVKKLYSEYSAEELPKVKEKIKEIVMELVEVVEKAIPTLLPEDFEDLTQQQLIDFTRYTADYLLYDMDLEKVYNAPMSLPYMETLGNEVKTNFYERDTNEYTRGDIHDTTDADDF